MLQKVHKTDKNLDKITNIKKEDDKNIRNWNIYLLHIKRMIKEYYKQLYTLNLITTRNGHILWKTQSAKAHSKWNRWSGQTYIH